MVKLNDAKLSAVLEREHAASLEQKKNRRAAWEASGRPAGMNPQKMDFRISDFHRTNYLSIGPAEGRFMYGQILAKGAKEIVEFGTSFGISTLYLAAAAAETGGRVTGSEFHPEKADRALSNLVAAGLEADIRVGDALETLAGEGPEIDFLFLDGAANLYVPVLDLLEPRLRPGSVIVADNIPVAKDEGHVLLDALQDRQEAYVTSIVSFGQSGMSYSVRL
ncbi:putative O-methyltransferase [Phaeobacter piscinae]|uniref:O-methyltransferase n=2 Tax=Roseobacteraceae TaxID=2854170 RepID=A0AAN1LBA0_9RHOB|nr:class I SAM-dependent methyltransferase [Phaeobacter piscinae]ATG44219.1 putative O-methyltransferase [Phaeobacter piscinae]AUQ73609.1 putative O-methyltransferase [Phaeobacter piscinae]AUR36529.1 putative O-methyltransferase [Phaeobacter piscinae]